MTCQHDRIETWRTDGGPPEMWACANPDCRLRFYPATEQNDARVAELEAQIEVLQRELDQSCSAEELRQTRQENKALQERINSLDPYGRGVIQQSEEF